jgi:hypothetical protein
MLHTGAAGLLVMAIITAGHGHNALKVLLAPLVATFNALLGAVGSNVRRCLLVTAQGHLPGFLGRAKHDCLVASGALSGDATRLLECGPKEVAMSVLPRALCAALGQRAHATLASLAANLGFVTLTLPRL